jgi:hypothetical protein
MPDQALKLECEGRLFASEESLEIVISLGVRPAGNPVLNRLPDQRLRAQGRTGRSRDLEQIHIHPEKVG